MNTEPPRASLQMVALEEIDYLDAMSSLLSDIVNSAEKLDILVHLYRLRFRPQRTSSIGRRLQLPAKAVAETLASLLQAGVVRTHQHDDDAGWWFDPNSSWASSIEVLVELYELDRNELLRFMKHVAFQTLREEDFRASVYLFARQRRPTQPN